MLPHQPAPGRKSYREDHTVNESSPTGAYFDRQRLIDQIGKARAVLATGEQTISDAGYAALCGQLEASLELLCDAAGDVLGESSCQRRTGSAAVRPAGDPLAEPRPLHLGHVAHQPEQRQRGGSTERRARSAASRPENFSFSVSR